MYRMLPILATGRWRLTVVRRLFAALAARGLSHRANYVKRNLAHDDAALAANQTGGVNGVRRAKRWRKHRGPPDVK
jgi:hypothetical protein